MFSVDWEKFRISFKVFMAINTTWFSFWLLACFILNFIMNKHDVKKKKEVLKCEISCFMHQIWIEDVSSFLNMIYGEILVLPLFSVELVV